MTNDFSEQTRQLFAWNRQRCWMCGRNHADCGHHTVGRGNKYDDCESSPLNFSPVNNWECHIGRNLRPYIKKFLAMTAFFLNKQGYELTDKDQRFMSKYKKYYGDFQLSAAATSEQKPPDRDLRV